MKMQILSFLVLFLFASPLFGQSIYRSTADEQTSVEITVYNSNIGLVKDVRQKQLPIGQNEVRLMDVAAQIMPETVHVRSISDPGKFEVLEQNYEYDLINSSKLLDKFVGKEVKIFDWNQYQDRKEIVDATLLSNNDGQIFRINNEIYLGYPGTKVVPEIPENLIAQPTLMWLVNNQSNTLQQIEVSYLTSNISWKSDYILVLNEKDTAADLSGWVTLDNRSGTSYNNAVLKLIAGDISRVQRSPGAYPKTYAMAEMGFASGAPQFEEKSFFEYHIYDLQRKTTIKNNQTKQISLLEAGGIKIQKEYLIYGIQSYFTKRFTEDLPKQPVQVYVKFKNSKENNLGMPLPAGIIRFYKKDDTESLQFIGEDQIKHTPENEELKLKVGEAFDITAERKQTDFQQITKNLVETEWEITVRNHKKEAVSVSLIEPLFGSWTVVSNSQPYTKKDSHTIQFDVTVPKDGETKVTYRVKTGY